MKTAPHQWGIAEALSQLHARTVSAEELAQALLDRAERIDGQVHAYLWRDPAQVLRDARAADQRRRREDADDLPPLLGVPLAIKDVMPVRGMPTSYHSRWASPEPAPEDAACVARLRAAGAILLGKLSTHEFAIGGPTQDLPYPAARNPWKLTHHPGGSSSGAAAGLAAALFPAAIGTDTGGSVRGPADACGVLGLKPTHGDIPMRGIRPLTYTLDQVGPMTRTARDLPLILAALSGRPMAISWREDLRGLRVGYLRHFHTEDVAADPEIAAALDTAAQDLRSLGADVREVRLPALPYCMAITGVVASVEAWLAHRDGLRDAPRKYTGRSRRRLAIGAFLSGADYLDAQRRRQALKADVDALLADCDLLLAASSLRPACRIDDDAAIDASYPFEARSPFSATGHPALNLPIGFTTSGLPIGAQFIGRYRGEAGLIAAAEAYLQWRWQARYPLLPADDLPRIQAAL